MPLTRRRFLVSGAAATAALALPAGRPPALHAATRGRTLVVLFLRGGADGLNLVVPHGDPDYEGLRPRIGLGRSATIPLDGFFGMNRDLPALARLFHRRALDVVHCAGLVASVRSHFDAQDFVERGGPGSGGVVQGWMNRLLERDGDGLPAGVTLGWSEARALAGPAPSLALPSLDAVVLRSERPGPLGDALREMHGARPGRLLAARTGEAISLSAALGDVRRNDAVPYPDGALGRKLRDLAALLRADLGVRLAAVDHEGWDHHSDEIDRMRGPARELDSALGAFHDDLGSFSDRVLTLVLTEFGRTAAENGSHGTDHGRASIALALGGGVTGGRVLVQDAWPGLAPAGEGPRRDLEVRTDVRDLLSEAVDRHLGTGRPQGLFPGHPSRRSDYPGLYRS